MKIRIATKAFAEPGDGPPRRAESLDEVVLGLQSPWIEINGTRISDYESLDVHVHNGVTLVTVAFHAAPEFVYLGENGEELT